MDEIQRLYNEHPINEQEILNKLKEAGRDLDNLSPEDVSVFDQDHYGGIEATDMLAQRLQIGEGSYVLDICSGLGGTSRYLAYRHGCRVMGVDLHKPRTESAIALTERVGLDDKVSYLCGDAVQLDFEDNTFDAALSQEAFLHITDKEALLNGCRRVIKPGGRLGFTDWIVRGKLSEAVQNRLRDIIAAVGIVASDNYLTLLEASGFSQVQFEDISEWWQGILRNRLEMFKSLRKETERQFGKERYDQYIAAYTVFVEQIEEGNLGGGRFCGVA